MNIPDKVGYEIGYRLWTAGTKPMSLFRINKYRHVWREFGRVESAYCAYDGGHSVPDENCSCGLYALEEPTDVYRYAGYNHTYIVGAVAMWGDVMKCVESNTYPQPPIVFYRSEHMLPLVVADTYFILGGWPYLWGTEPSAEEYHNMMLVKNEVGDVPKVPLKELKGRAEERAMQLLTLGDD